MSVSTTALPNGIRATSNEWLVIGASSLGTVFEWYDFYLYGLLASILTTQFFSGVNETTGFIFALAAFAAGFAVRPFGALVFGLVLMFVYRYVNPPFFKGTPTAWARKAVEEQRKAGVTPEMIRLSIGIEHADDIVADLEQALQAAAGKQKESLSAGSDRRFSRGG